MPQWEKDSRTPGLCRGQAGPLQRVGMRELLGSRWSSQGGLPGGGETSALPWIWSRAETSPEGGRQDELCGVNLSILQAPHPPTTASVLPIPAPTPSRPPVSSPCSGLRSLPSSSPPSPVTAVLGRHFEKPDSNTQSWALDSAHSETLLSFFSF